MKIIAFVTERESVRQILDHIGEPSDPPRVAPARGPPQFELAFDQTVDAPGDEDLDQTRGLPDDHWA